VDQGRAGRAEAKPSSWPNSARLPIVFKHVAVMPDVHFGIGATIGSVIPTFKAIIPAAVGVDIGCGMMACKTTLRAEDLPDNLGPLRRPSKARAARPRPRPQEWFGARPGAWTQDARRGRHGLGQLVDEFEQLCRDYPKLKNTNNHKHLGTLGGGNHFVEVCLDEQGFVWFMLHSGSRGVGNAIGTHFIELAKQDAMRNQRNLPDQDLAYLEEGQHFGDYVRAVGWAQKFARLNREVMMQPLIEALRKVITSPSRRTSKR
jgi:tRNA-splicing ligase RtcB